MMGQNWRLHQLTKGAFHFVTSPGRILPDFLIIGAMKSGTTSLYHYLSSHPWIRPALKKELFFFSNDNPFWRNSLWYRAHFPMVFEKYWAALGGRKMLTFEATPGYIFHPLAPARIQRIMAQGKFILLLRNPVERSYAHYQNIVRTNHESLSFEAALDREREMYLGKDRGDLDYLVYSYLGRSIYIEQLERWLQFFSRDQLLILENRELADHTNQVLEMVFSFLELPMSNYPALELYPKYEAFEYPPMNAATRRVLVDFFRPYNQRLYDLLGVDFGWE